MKHDSFNESTEMYLKTILELTDADERPVPISALAERLGVSNVSATEMVHRLQNQGLLNHTPYKGVNLALKGRQWATALIRSHHMWEVFLADKLAMPWEQVHDFACRLEHATDTAVTEALAAFLNHPARCPHGNPIPAPDGTIAAPDDVSLADLKPGQTAVVSRISPESTLLLDYLAARGIRPGVTLVFTEVAPFNGPILIRMQTEASDVGQEHALGQEIAHHIFVTPVGEPDAKSAHATQSTLA